MASLCRIMVKIFMNEIIKILKDYLSGEISEKSLRTQLNSKRKEFEKDFGIDKIEEEAFLHSILANDSDDFNKVVEEAVKKAADTADLKYSVAVRLPYRYNKILESVSRLVLQKRKLDNNEISGEAFAKEYYMVREIICESFDCLESPKTLYDIVYNNIIILAEAMTDSGGFSISSIFVRNYSWCMEKLESLLKIYRGEGMCLVCCFRSNGITDISIVL